MTTRPTDALIKTLKQNDRQLIDKDANVSVETIVTDGDVTVGGDLYVLGNIYGDIAITTQNEGTTLSTGVTTLNFVGDGVTATGSGATTTVTIAGGGASPAVGAYISGTVASTIGMRTTSAVLYGSKIQSGSIGFDLVTIEIVVAVGGSTGTVASAFWNAGTLAVDSTGIDTSMTITGCCGTIAGRFDVSLNADGSVGIYGIDLDGTGGLQFSVTACRLRGT
jgi:hypothetical protein